MITITVTGPGQDAALFVKWMRSVVPSFPREYGVNPGEVCYVDDATPRPDLTGVNYLVEVQPELRRSEGPWEIFNPPEGYVRILGYPDEGQTDIVCEVWDNQFEAGNAAAIAKVPEMEAALEAVLIFHHSGWNDIARQRWRRLTDSTEATTKILCDTVRRALAR